MQSLGQQELDKQREICPRLYFLSDDELSKMLSDPSAFGEHAIKVFEPSQQGTFDMVGNDIVGMSDKGDSLKFDAPVAMGAPAETIDKVIDEMRKAVRREIDSAMKVEGGISALIASNHIQQAIELTDLIRTTRETEACREGGFDALKARFAQLNAKLDELSQLTKKDHSNAKAMVIKALIALNANHRDFIQNHMLNHCDAAAWPLHFQKWELLQRYYYTDEVVIKIDTFELKYGHEYLGSYDRLCMTELTNYTYTQLARGMIQGTGVIQSGPAGTGKTETTKDFCRNLGLVAMVINCSDLITVDIMERLVKGGKDQGVAILFDEYNLINKDVSGSSLAILNKHLSNKKVLVTLSMNPGHAMRKELQHEYWETFSRIIFTLPDRAKIAQVQLYNQGFGSASDLLGKLYNTSMRQFESDLSKQRHYDFGLRAMISTWRRGGMLIKKGLSPGDALVTAMHLQTFAGLSNADKPLYENIIKTNFLDAQVVLEAGDFDAKFAAAHPDASDYTKLKAGQIHTMSTMRHGLLVMGGDGKVVQDVVTVMGGSCTVLETTDNVEDFFEKSLWGALDQAQGKNHHWIVIEDKGADWSKFDQMHTLTDDNKVLKSKSGERMMLPQTCRIVVHAQKADGMSPAMVSRHGVINMMEGQ